MDTPFLVTSLKLPGESYDLQACYSKRDEHFDCMDRFKSVAGPLQAFLYKKNKKNNKKIKKHLRRRKPL